jgi:AraC-like DNA-binding protein
MPVEVGSDPNGSMHFFYPLSITARFACRLLKQRSQDSHSLQKRPSRARHDRLSQPNRSANTNVRAARLMSRDTDQNASDGTERSGRARLVPARSGFAPVEAAITTATLTVDHVDEADRFAFWREQWCQGTAGVTGELASGERHRFYARGTAWTASCVIRLRLVTGPFRVSRGLPEISRHSLENWICLYQEMSDGATFQHAGNEFTTRPGDLLLTDPTIPFSGRPRSVHDYRRWMLPRAWIEPHLPAGRRPLSAQFAGAHGINGLVQAYLHALNDAIDECDSAELPGVIDNFCRLLALACGGGPGDQRAATRAAKLRQVKDYIALHLSEPDLTPTSVAAAMKISVRQLHFLFEPTETSFAEHVLGRRLEECRAILESPSSRARSVTDIAYAWGFNSLPSFYRAFHQRFGVCPGMVRRG